MNCIKTLTLLVVVLSVTACQKKHCLSKKKACNFDTELKSEASVLDESQLNDYYEIWKSILLEKSDMTAAYFNSHITAFSLSSSEWSAGISFKIEFIINVNWVDIKCSDAFIVKMNSSYEAYQHLNIPRDVFLDQTEVQSNIERDVHSEITKYNTIEDIKYANCDEIYDAISNGFGKSDLSADRVSYHVPGKLPREDGDPYYLFNSSHCKQKKNCSHGYINLVTGEKEVWKEACVIVG